MDLDLLLNLRAVVPIFRPQTAEVKLGKVSGAVDGYSRVLRTLRGWHPTPSLDVCEAKQLQILRFVQNDNRRRGLRRVRNV